MRSGVGWGRVTRASYTALGRRASVGSGGGRESQISERDEHFDAVARLFQGRAATLLAVDHGEHTEDAPAFGFHGGDGLARRAAGRDHIFDHDDARLRGEAPLDPAAGAVGLDLLAHREGIERYALGPGGERDGVGDRVGAEREAADGLRAPVPRAEPGEAERPDQGEALSGHRGAPGVDVKRGSPAGGEREVAAPHGALQQELAQSSVVVGWRHSSSNNNY